MRKYSVLRYPKDGEIYTFKKSQQIVKMLVGSNYKDPVR